MLHRVQRHEPGLQNNVNKYKNTIWFGLGARHHFLEQMPFSSVDIAQRWKKSVLHHPRHGSFLENRLNCQLSYLPHRPLKTPTEVFCCKRKKKKKRWRFSARSLDTSSFKKWVITFRSNICGKKMAVTEMSLQTLTSFISSWTLCWGSSKGTQDLVSSMPSSREVSVMEIAPGGEQDHILAQREWRSKSGMNEQIQNEFWRDTYHSHRWGKDTIDIQSHNWSHTRGGRTGMLSQGLYALLQQHGALLTPVHAAHVGRYKSTGKGTDKYVSMCRALQFSVWLLPPLHHIIRTDFSLL